MELKELKKQADTLNDSCKRELIDFLQSRIRVFAVSILIIDEIREQKYNNGLVCPHCESHAVVRFRNSLLKHEQGT